MAQTLLSDVDVLDKEIKNLSKAREKKLLEIQNACSHPLEAIIARERRPEFIAPSNAVFYDSGARCCKLCGYGEEGYSFWKLRLSYTGVPVVSADAFRTYLKKLYGNEELIKLRTRK
ncbi:MAG: hypothetical protein AABW88_00160 [Nanoarchaeota archaeon]